jgi:hypothetical protein
MDYGKQEAIRRRNDQDNNNAEEDMEFAYSPSTGAVGCRLHGGARFGVFNVNYPMYGKSEMVADWISVGVARAIGERGKRRFH